MTLHVLYLDSLIVGATNKHPFAADKQLNEIDGVKFDRYEEAWDWKSFDQVSEIAAKLTAMTGKTYLPGDQGSGVSPRYRVFRPPELNDPVSKTFNGDSYPQGYICRITPTWQITTTTGAKFYRYKQTTGWREAGRGFWLCHGHIYEQNPSF